MKKTYTTTLLLFLFSVNIMAQKADDIIGKYNLPNNIDVEFFKKDLKYFGKIIKLNNFENGMKTDLNNPNKLKRNDLLIGKVIIENLEFNADEKQWINGSMYGAEKGLIFDFKITKYRDSEIEIVGSKYIFWKTLIWTKI